MIHPNKNSREHYRILVVEDDRLQQMLFKKALGDVHAIHAASSISDGWIQFTETRPEIIFMDVHLPDGSGHDLARKIKEQNPLAYVIMAAASHDKADKIMAAQTHVDYFITKPFSKKMLDDCVGQYARRA